MCEKGFHFCRNAQDTLNFYCYNRYFELMEIDVLGDIIDKADKSVTNKFKVIRVIPRSEYPELLGVMIDENNNIIKQYDGSNNETKEADQDGGVWLREYDSNKNLIKKVSPSGKNIWLYEYDGNNNEIKRVYPNGEIYLFEYAENDKLIKRVYPNGNVYLFEYDENNKCIKIIYPSGDTSLFEYDSNGNMIKCSNQNGYIWEIMIS